MNKELPDTSVEILGKSYQIKCPESEVTSLRRAAEYLESNMRLMREAGVLSADKVAVITALNVIHQLQIAEQQKNHYIQSVNQRLLELQGRVEQALAQTAQMELQSAE
jgi:cell division protein ZapA